MRETIAGRGVPGRFANGGCLELVLFEGELGFETLELLFHVALDLELDGLGGFFCGTKFDLLGDMSLVRLRRDLW